MLFPAGLVGDGSSQDVVGTGRDQHALRVAFIGRSGAWSGGPSSRA
jgi:hypothetical protein